MRTAPQASGSQNADDKNASRLLGNVAYRKNDFKAAETHYTQCIEMKGNDNDCQSLALSNR